VRKTYAMGEQEVVALDAVDLTLETGEFTVFAGPSGSGKSTLLNLVGCLDRPSAGHVLIEGKGVDGLSDDALGELRARRIGFIFQSFNLIPVLSAFENVELALRLAGVADGRKERVEKALADVGLQDHMRRLPSQLSGGQQQRVAIARALVTEPSLLLADEPTGNLDTRTTLEVMALFQQLHREGVTMIIVTHEEEVASYCTRRLFLRDGRIVQDAPVAPRDAAADLAALAMPGGAPR
jgi:putative ABC transport system ATP-binding protein